MGKNQSKPSLPSYSRYCESGGNSEYTHYDGRTIGYGNSALIGRQKMAEEFSGYTRIYVTKITPQVLGRELVRRCGNEGRHRYLDWAGQTTLKFLRAGISFIPMALAAGADLYNASFIFAHPQREFVITAGKGDWEFYFYHSYNGDIYGHCVRKPLLRYIWDKVKSTVKSVGSYLLPIITPPLLALMF